MDQYTGFHDDRNHRTCNNKGEKPKVTENEMTSGGESPGSPVLLALQSRKVGTGPRHLPRSLYGIRNRRSAPPQLLDNRVGRTSLELAQLVCVSAGLFHCYVEFLGRLSQMATLVAIVMICVMLSPRVGEGGQELAIRKIGETREKTNKRPTNPRIRWQISPKFLLQPPG